MELIGDNGDAAPRLKDAKLNEEDFREMYTQVRATTILITHLTSLFGPQFNT